jgi:hypothetical protein
VLVGKLGSVAGAARALASDIPGEARNLAAAMADGADAFVARVRAGGMQMAASGGGGGPGPHLGGLSAETLAEAVQAAKAAYKGKRSAQDAAKHAEHGAGHREPTPHTPDSAAQPAVPVVPQHQPAVQVVRQHYSLRPSDVGTGHAGHEGIRTP